VLLTLLALIVAPFIVGLVVWFLINTELEKPVATRGDAERAYLFTIALLRDHIGSSRITGKIRRPSPFR